MIRLTADVVRPPRRRPDDPFIQFVCPDGGHRDHDRTSMSSDRLIYRLRLLSTTHREGRVLLNSKGAVDRFRFGVYTHLCAGVTVPRWLPSDSVTPAY